MTFLIALMSFANFVFYPLVISAIIAVIIEQILRARGDEDNPKDVKNVFFAMGISCLLYTSPSPRDATLSPMPASA